MNILILVTGFLIVMTFGLSALFKQSGASVRKQNYFYTFFDLERKAQNGTQRRAFRRLVVSETKDPQKSSSSRLKSFVRDREDPYDESKLNLTPLLQQPPPPFFDRLYEIAAKHLYLTYEKTSVGLLAKKTVGEDFAYQLLDAMIEKGRLEKEVLSFETLLPEDAALREIYVKMAKGTKQYELPSHGYPPLEDFFLLSKEKKMPAHFCFASTPLLKALFGEELAGFILRDEEIHGRALKIDELKTLVLQHPESKVQMTDFNDFLSMVRTPSAAPTFTLMDNKSKISHKVRKPKSKGGSSS